MSLLCVCKVIPRYFEIGFLEFLAFLITFLFPWTVFYPSISNSNKKTSQLSEHNGDMTMVIFIVTVWISQSADPPLNTILVLCLIDRLAERYIPDRDSFKNRSRLGRIQNEAQID